MTDRASVAATADRLSRRRTRILWVQAVIFVLWQTSFFSWGDPEGPLRTVDQVKVGAWALWSLALLVLVSTGGGWFQSREVRRLLNDEVSVSNRRRGQQAGFVTAVIAGIAVYLVSQVEPVTARDAVHAVLTVGLGVALFRYALLERRAERGS